MNILSHKLIQPDVDIEVEKIRKQIIAQGDDVDVTVKEKLDILDQLTKFEYGRWLLVNKGLNAYWSRYYRHVVLFGYYPPMENQLEIFMTQKSPGVLSTYEQYHIQNDILMECIRDDMCVASVPCGLMDLPLRLKLDDRKNLKFFGVDLDPAAIEGAKENAKSLGKEHLCEFMVKDAWSLGIENKFDLLISNGLNIHAPTDESLVALYKNFYDALKPNGCLLVSALTAPITETGEVYWDMSKIDMNALRLQKIVFFDVIQLRKGLSCSEKQTIAQLTKAGFKDIRVFYDSRKIFLSMLAYKIPN